MLIGNPPWIVYRHLSPEMKDRLREALQQLRSLGRWQSRHASGHVCAVLGARRRTLSRDGGTLALRLPYAVLNAPVFAGMRDGSMERVRVAITGGWALERVWPIFGAQSGSSTTSTCVLFGERDRAGPLPAEIDRWVGCAAPARCQRG